MQPKAMDTHESLIAAIDEEWMEIRTMYLLGKGIKHTQNLTIGINPIYERQNIKTRWKCHVGNDG